jgi:hypothetical protein
MPKNRMILGEYPPIRLIFDQPQKLRCISLVFEEIESERTQEFVLRWSGDGGSSFRVQLFDVNVLELVIKPDIGGETPARRLKTCVCPEHRA